MVEATIVSITTFGAFARIADNVDGLIHISQLDTKRVNDVKEVVALGDVVTVKITEINEEQQRISLSIREVLEDNAPEAEETDALVYSDENPEAVVAASDDEAAE